MNRITFALLGLIFVLVPVVVHAVTGTLPYSVTSGGGTTACDIGPPYTGAIPAAATQAGFTHCAMNFDFTYTGSWTDALGTHQWCAGSLPCSISNMSSWFNCTALTETSNLFFFYGNVPCDTAHVTITTDSGKQALAMSYYQTDANAGNSDNVIEGQGNINGANENPLPSEYYAEIVYRLNATQTSGSFYILYDVSSLTSTTVNPPGCYVASDQEWDSFRTNTGTGLAIYDPSCVDGGITPQQAMDTQLRTSAKLITGDGVNQFASCLYAAVGAISGLPGSSFVGCYQGAVHIPPASLSIFGVHLYEYIEEGPYHNAGISNWDIPSHTTYTFRRTFWTCAGYTSGSCTTNSVITTAPP